MHFKTYCKCTAIYSPKHYCTNKLLNGFIAHVVWGGTVLFSWTFNDVSKESSVFSFKVWEQVVLFTDTAFGATRFSESSWLQVHRSGFDSQFYQIFWEVVGLERGPLSLVSTIEAVLERKGSGSCLKNRDYAYRGSVVLTTQTPLYPKKLALTSPTSGGRSVGIVRSWTKAVEFF
jgi:hypothetical protein